MLSWDAVDGVPAAVYDKRVRFNGVIQRKLALLDTQVMNLKRYLSDVDRSTFVEDRGLRSMAERALQVATEKLDDFAAFRREIDSLG